MTFRNATIRDLPLIVEIYNSTIAGRMVTADTEPVTIASKQKWFYEHNPEKRPLWIVEDDGSKTIGWVSFQNFYGRPAYDGTAEISIYIDETERGKGYGKRILQHSIAAAPALQIHTLLGFIFAQNAPSIDLFAKQGFEEWAHLKDVAVLDEKKCSLKIFGRQV